MSLFPADITRKDQIDFNVTLQEYLANEWALGVTLLLSDGTTKEYTSTEEAPDTYKFSIPAEDTTLFSIGNGEYQFFVSSETVTRKSIESGAFKVLPSLFDENVTPETDNERKLREAEEKLEELMISGTERWSYRDREVHQIKIDDLQKAVAYYQQKVYQERRRKAGLSQFVNIKYGFGIHG